MTNIVKRALRQWSLVVPLALLALPACTSFEAASNVTYTVDRGVKPLSSAVFCDIQQPPGRRCANPTDVGIPLQEAAIALVTGRSSTIGLDTSPTARDHCGGAPEAVLFQGPFPDGVPVCLNCNRIGAPPLPYADANALCVAYCKDLFASSGQPGDPAVFCDSARAHVSTNFTPTGGACVDGACLDLGTPRADFFDARRVPEPVVWKDLIGVGVTGATLIRTAPTPPDPQVFDAGAASGPDQLIIGGDGYVEFTANETDKTRLCGLTTAPLPDTNPRVDSIDFAIDLFKDGHFYVFEKGAKIAGRDTDPAHPDAFGTYHNGQRFRIKFKNNFDGRAQITYARVLASCIDGSPCSDEVFFPLPGSGLERYATYPFHVDSSFHDQGATLENVRVVRIR